MKEAFLIAVRAVFGILCGFFIYPNESEQILEYPGERKAFEAVIKRRLNSL